MPKPRTTHTSNTNGSPCACGAPDCNGPGRSVGPGKRAAAVDPAIKDANLKHLRRIEGQVRGIACMVDDERYCADIITQIAAVRESLHAVARNLMRNHLRHCAARAMSRQGKSREDMINELVGLVTKVVR